MLSDFRFIIFWWLVIFLLSSLSLPLIFLIFKNFWDKGYIFTKIISLILLSYLVLIGGIFKIIPFTNLSLFILIFIGLSLNFFFLFKKDRYLKFLETIKSNYKIFLFEELLFLIILIAWSFVRGFAPDIEGLEKFMDWGFINSMLRTQYMPPLDMWFAGSSINYYYFGHLMFAVLTKLSNISSAIIYNLSIATVCALTFVSTFSLASNLVFLSQKKIKFRFILIAGLISALLLTFGGNLHPVYKIGKNYFQNAKKLDINSYWYPDATRFIGHDPDTKDKTIHEFPVYSFVVSDLHGHMNDIPVVLFFIAFLFALSFKKCLSFLNWKVIIPSGFILAIAYMTNAWDFAIYGLLYAIFIFFINLKPANFSTAFVKTFVNGIFVIGFWYLFSLPFALNFTPLGDGIRIADAHSPFYQLFVLYGGFWLIVMPFLFLLIKKLLIRNWKLEIRNSDLFVLALIITATLLIIIPELVYLKDIYIFEHRRSNTMFKLVYEAFIMYSLVSGYVLIRLTQLFNKPLSFFYKLIFFLVLTSHLIYPYFAIKSYYGLKNYKGLWGLNYLKNSYPDNFLAINWINQNIKGQPVMLEAVGDSYTTFNQVSVSTGLPTVEGWVVHEWLWRGGYDQPGARQTDVQKIYESEDINEVKSLLQKYSVEYIFVGNKEVEKYPKLNEKNLNKIGEIIFQSGKTKIYKLFSTL